jgi:hypothetical protein
MSDGTTAPSSGSVSGPVNGAPPSGSTTCGENAQASGCPCTSTAPASCGGCGTQTCVAGGGENENVWGPCQDPCTGGNVSDAGMVALVCEINNQAQGCPCSPGTQAACGGCGTSQCVVSENGDAWGPCSDPCALNSDGGFHPYDGGVCAANNSGCVPGAMRWCDDGSCFWGQQVCDTTGNWGLCTDVPNRAGPSTCLDFEYDENCCEQSGACCAHADEGTNYGSVGNCGAVDPCNACAQLCVPGAVRYCAVGTYMLEFIGGSAGWGQQPCLATGVWGACVPAAPPGSCSDNEFDPACCEQTGACCEHFDDEAADPSSVNCPATPCETQWRNGESGCLPVGQPCEGADGGGCCADLVCQPSGENVTTCQYPIAAFPQDAGPE